MKVFLLTSALLALCSFSTVALALQIPSGFEAQTSDEHLKLWMNPETMETLSVSDDDVSQSRPSKDALNEIRGTFDAQAFAISQTMNVKDWSVSESASDRSEDGTQTVWAFGSYTDSSDEKVHFAEVFSLKSKEKKGEGYLFTRPQKAWTKKDLSDRFKVTIHE